tara:strand:+ start:302 stop:874 length:573 start_codon:yes stop_codon:yes gene_type:complete
MATQKSADREITRILTSFLHDVGDRVFKLSKEDATKVTGSVSQAENQVKLIKDKGGFRLELSGGVVDLLSPDENNKPKILQSSTFQSKRHYRKATTVVPKSPRYKVGSYLRSGGYVRAHPKTWKPGFRPRYDESSNRWRTDSIDTNFGYRMSAVKRKNDWVAENIDKIFDSLSDEDIILMAMHGVIPEYE